MTRFLQFVIQCSIPWLLANEILALPTLQSEDAIRHFQNGIADQVTTPSGDRYFLHPKMVFHSRRGIPKDFARVPKSRNHSIEYRALTIDPANPRCCLALAFLGENRKDGFTVLSIGPEGQEEVLYKTRWHLKSPMIVPLDSGAFVVVCDSGQLFVVGRNVQADYKVPGDYPLQATLPKLEIQVVANQVVFYHPAVYDRNRPYLKSPVLYTNGKFIAVSEAESIGPTTLWNETSTVTLIQNAIVFDDFVARKRIQSIAIPNNGMIPTRLFRDGKGELYGQFRNSFVSSRHYDVASLKDGRFHQLMRWNGSTFESMDVNRDRLLYHPTFEVQAPNGSWWLSSGDELMERIENGSWRRWDSNQWLGFSNIDRIRFESDRVLWTFDDRTKASQRIDLDLLEKEPPVDQARFHFEHARRYHTHNGTRIDWLLDGGEHLRVTSSAFQVSIPIPVCKPLIRQESVQVWIDSRRLPWIIGESNDSPTCRWNGKEWLCFYSEDAKERPDRKDSLRLACEEAWKTDGEGVLVENHVRFFEQGVAILDRQGLFSFFDGDRWFTEIEPPSGRRINLATMEWKGDRIRTFDQSKTMHELELSRLDRAEFQSTNWAWERIAPRLSKGDRTLNLASIAWKKGPQSFPPFDKVEWQSGNLLQFANKRLAVKRPEQPWSLIDLPFTINPRRLSNIVFDPQENLILTAEDQRIERHLVVEAEKIPSQVKSQDLGRFSELKTEVPLEIRTDSIDDIWIRYRVEPLPWSEWIPRPAKILLPVMHKPGDYSLQVEVHHAQHFAKLEKLSLQFSVDYELEDRVEKLVQQLDSSKFSERDNAYCELESLGPAVVMILPRYVDGASRETRTSIRGLLDHYLEPTNPK